MAVVAAAAHFRSLPVVEQAAAAAAAAAAAEAGRQLGAVAEGGAAQMQLRSAVVEGVPVWLKDLQVPQLMPRPEA